MEASNSSLLRFNLWLPLLLTACLGSTKPPGGGLLRAMPSQSQQMSKAGVSGMLAGKSCSSKHNNDGQAAATPSITLPVL